MMESETPPPPPIPVTIIGGFLGAGKTSLLNHILTGDHGRRIAVLVNDFGAINIDAALVAGRNGEVVSLENGCICCSLADGLLVSAMRLIRRPDPPEHIVIETSGVSDPIAVARTFEDPDLQPYAPLDGIVTVVDAEQAPHLVGDVAALARRQVQAADVVLLNKVDLVDDVGRAAAQAWVRRQSSGVRILETLEGRAPLPLILGLGGAAAVPHDAVPEVHVHASGEHHHHHHDHALQFDSASFESDEPLPIRRLHALLGSLPPTVFRAKGIVNLVEKPDHRCILQATGRRATLTVGAAWGEDAPTTRLVFIGSKGGVDAASIRRDLAGSELA